MVSTIAPLQPYGATHRSSDNTLRKSSHDVAIVLIGPKQAKFKVVKKLLCAASPFFRQQLDEGAGAKPSSRSVSLWLPSESPAMFALFVEWLHSKHTFRSFLDDAVNNAHNAHDSSTSSNTATRDFQWALIHLHLFASHLSLFHLQDLAMDAIQDLYLRCDWDVPPSLIAYLYTKCEALHSVRLRRWAVAMVAFSIANSGASSSSSDLKLHPEDATAEAEDLSRFQYLLDSLQEFNVDYAMHLRKLRASRLNIRLKNPQLRIPANKLRNEERAFGFRECSFHSHRAAVGQRSCPHELVGMDKNITTFEHMPTEVDELKRLAGSVRRKQTPGQPTYPSAWEEDAVQPLSHVRSVSSVAR